MCANRERPSAETCCRFEVEPSRYQAFADFAPPCGRARCAHHSPWPRPRLDSGADQQYRNLALLGPEHLRAQYLECAVGRAGPLVTSFNDLLGTTLYLVVATAIQA